ncbi:MAG: hypothetical protein PHY93_18010 [Bacteriovorax sp.]|nr:hypothetical protein [Bacteriovorax sp.]
MNAPPGDLVFRDNSGTEKARVWSQVTAGAGLNLSGRSNATPDLFINSTGNVGIGTVTPQAKLEVNGGPKSRGIICFGKELPAISSWDIKKSCHWDFPKK